MNNTEIEEAKQFYIDYCRESGIGEVTPWVMVGSDSIIIGNRKETAQYPSSQFMGPHLMFNTDGSVMTGTLWGGDVWDDGTTIREATTNQEA